MFEISVIEYGYGLWSSELSYGETSDCLGVIYSVQGFTTPSMAFANAETIMVSHKSNMAGMTYEIEYRVSINDVASERIIVRNLDAAQIIWAELAAHYWMVGSKPKALPDLT